MNKYYWVTRSEHDPLDFEIVTTRSIEDASAFSERLIDPQPFESEQEAMEHIVSIYHDLEEQSRQDQISWEYNHEG